MGRRNGIGTIERLKRPFLLLLTGLLLVGCLGPFVGQPPRNSKKAAASTATPAATPEKKPGTVETPPVGLNIWFDPSVPPALRKSIALPAEISQAQDVREANLMVTATSGKGEASWVYALVAPFPTLMDGVSIEDVRAAWRGESSGPFASRPLYLTAATKAAFDILWGPSAGKRIKVAGAGALLETAWQQRPSWALVPFEDLDPRWKVLRLDGQSPLDRALAVDQYPLVVPFTLAGTTAAMQQLDAVRPAAGRMPLTNRDPEKMTVLVMTGVTALVRATGAKMEAKGMTYPGKDIRDWLRSADLTHISNEIAFSPHCPPANAYQETLQFCSRPEYIELLEDVGTDIVEMTGNHMLDWNADSFEYTLQMYRDRNWGFYASGIDLESARNALLVEDHGNKLAFIGCNPAGPSHAWATENSPGIADCDYEWMHAEITRLREAGYLPIATFQYHEYYTPEARPWQELDFKGQAEAGAVIVSGSQAHVPQAIDFSGGSFIHYGLGNLFFDQMDVPVVGTRREFIDRHVFYNGRYISTELLTAMLEEYARPRPMTPEERQSLLTDIFTASGWIDEQVGE